MFRSNKYHVLARLYAESPLVVNWTRGTSKVSFKEKGKGMCLENRKTGWMGLVEVTNLMEVILHDFKFEDDKMITVHVRKFLKTRWFKVTFSSPSWRSLNHVKFRSLNHPQKVTSRIARGDIPSLMQSKVTQPLPTRWSKSFWIASEASVVFRAACKRIHL